MGIFDKIKKEYGRTEKKVKKEAKRIISDPKKSLTAIGTGGLSLLAPDKHQDTIEDVYMGGAALAGGAALLGVPLVGAGGATAGTAGATTGTGATAGATTGGMSNVALAATLGSSVIGGGLSYLGSEKLAEASEDAAIAQRLSGEQGISSIQEGTERALEALETGKTGAITAQEESLQNILEAKGLGTERATEAQKEASLRSQETLTGAKNEQIALQRQVFAQQQALNQPWQQAGLEALQKYSEMPEFSFTAEDFTADPSYEFRKQEGITALDRSAAARGRVLSGGQDRAIARYASDLASQEYGNAYNRALAGYNTEANRQLNIAGLGSQATGRMTTAAGQMGSNIGNTISQTGSNIANIQQQEGVNLANLLSSEAATQASAYGQQGSNLANIYQGYGQNVANLQTQQGSNLANIYAGMGQAQAQGIIGAGQAQAQGTAGIGSAINTGISNALLYNYLS